MSSRPRPASLPAEGGPSSWSFVIRASATELVRAPAGLQVGGPLADSTHVSRSFSPPVAVFPPPARFSAPAGGVDAAAIPRGVDTTSGSTTSSTSSIVVA